ncbi:MAG: TRAP transporter substrate-binding protein [Oligoflexia bacterium]|nr:TRAP transporter substrate-binding protein [Oligoflexia bacterium]
MMKKRRFTAFTSVLSMCFVSSFSFLLLACGGGNYTFKYANSQSDSHPRSQSMAYFKTILEERSEGRITVELYTAGVMGTESETLDMVIAGTDLQGYRGGNFSTISNQLLLYTLPFFFENTTQATALMRSDFGKAINASAEANGLHIPATGVAGGFRNITTSAANAPNGIRNVADLSGLKMRTPSLEITTQTFEALGADPTEVAYADTYVALQNGTVDGQENPFSNIVDMKFYEVQDHLSVVNWELHPDPFVVNLAWYNDLPDDLKEIFDEAAEDAMAYSDQIWLASETSYFATLASELTVVTPTASARADFVDAVEDVWTYGVTQGYYTQAQIDEAQTFIANY